MKINFGRYKDLSLSEIPTNYIKWLLKNEILKSNALLEAKQVLENRKQTYDVTVENSLGQDGTYQVKALTNKEAIQECKLKYNVRCSQSFDGTDFTVKRRKLNL